MNWPRIGRTPKPIERMSGGPPPWNGWAGAEDRPSLNGTARRLLADRIGPGTVTTDASLDDVVGTVAAGRLPAHPLVDDAPEGRVRHASGQSFPDWVARRSGRIDGVPDAVAYPADGEAVRDLLRYAAEVGARVIPFGGGTSVVGGVTRPRDEVPHLTVDLGRLAGMQRLGASSGLATFGAGTVGPAIEDALRERGWTLGHYPQSYERSTLGGWVATRSAGQQSLGFGRIEDLFAGGTLEAPAGTLDLPAHPGSAAGPDLRQLALGSEGRLGILTDITVRAVPLPQTESMTAMFLPSWEAALTLARDLVQAGLPMSMVRVLSPAETVVTLTLAGRSARKALMTRYLGMRGVTTDRSLMLIGFSGRRRIVDATRREVSELGRARGGIGVGGALTGAWRRERFRSAGLRDALWAAGYGVDTVETATDWPRLPALQEGIEGRIVAAAATAFDERALVFSHLSHVYPTGASLYTTIIFQLAADPDETLARWTALKAAASSSIVDHGATISHQHGVGRDHAAHLAAEKGALGMDVLRDVARRLDPAGTMNPGALLEEAE